MLVPYWDSRLKYQASKPQGIFMWRMWSPQRRHITPQPQHNITTPPQQNTATVHHSHITSPPPSSSTFPPLAGKKDFISMFFFLLLLLSVSRWESVRKAIKDNIWSNKFPSSKCAQNVIFSFHRHKQARQQASKNFKVNPGGIKNTKRFWRTIISRKCTLRRNNILQ